MKKIFKTIQIILLIGVVLTLYSCNNTRAKDRIAEIKDDSIMHYRHTIDSLYNTVIYGQKVEIAELKERHSIDSTNFENALVEIERLNGIIKSMRGSRIHYNTKKNSPCAKTSACS